MRSLAEKHTYSVRLVRPFVSVLERTGTIDREWLEALHALDQDFRFPVEVAHQMLAAAVEFTGDQDLGLRAARACHPIAVGIINYVVNSAPTVKLAFEAASRYMGLVNDALEVRLAIDGDRATLRLESRVPLSRAARDFEVGALYRAFGCIWDAGAGDGVRIAFTHDAPERIDEYAETFDRRPVDFGAPFTGFTFDARRLEAPLATAERNLHRLVADRADRLLEDHRTTTPFTGRVRAAIMAELTGGNPSICRVAELLHMSPRTLERRLEREGATFSNVQDALRRDLALRHVADASLELAELAFLLGFSQTTGFHRAFKRWTGRTPLEYRLAARSAGA